MPINTIEYAKIYQQKLDEQAIAGATSGWMEDNAGQVKYTGGNECKIPKMSMNGLGDYDRDSGFPRGALSYAYETKTLTQDRGRQFHLDSMDIDEMNFPTAAASVMSVFQKEQVIPEIDAYRYSKIFTVASEAGRVNSTAYTPDKSTLLEALMADIAAVQDEIGETVPLVISMSTLCAAVLDNVSDISRKLEVTNFKQGGVDLKVKSINDIPIIRVPSARMKSIYVFNDGVTEGQTGGGFAAASGAEPINWLITARTTPIAVSKTEKIRIFTPDQNQNADAWKIDYRKYHDLWIMDNKIKTIMANKGSAD